VLWRYTGQRISDIIRLGYNDVDEGGFALPQKKTGVRPWCPIFPELEAEMATREKRPDPFLLQESGRSKGKPFTTNGLWRLFNKAREQHAVLQGAVPLGLRASAVVRLRQASLTSQQISDMVDMSVPMIERYFRYADRKAGGQAVLLKLKQQGESRTRAKL
jgi:integrase